MRRYVLLVALVVSFVTPFMGSSVNVAVPDIGQSLSLEAVTLNWVVTAFLVASAVFLLPFGRAADLYGRRRVFLTGITAFAACSLLCGLAPSGETLIAFRLLQGASSAMIFGTSLAILAAAYPPKERGRVIGLTVGAVYTGLSAGPVIGGFLTTQLGWRSIFLFNFVLSLAVAVIAFRHLPRETRHSEFTSFDWPGAGLYSLGLAGFMYGMANLGTGRHPGWVLAAGIVLLTAFGLWELRTRQPLLELTLFRIPVFAFSNLASLIHYSATFAVGLLLSLYLQVVKGFDAQQAGLVLLSQPVLMALVAPIAGRLSDRFEPRIIATAGMALTFAGLVLFTFLHTATAMAVVVGNLVLIGIGLGLFSSPNTNAIMSSVERSRYGVASAAVGTVRLIGQALSMALVTFFFALYLQGREVTPEAAPLLMKSLRVSFLCFACFCAVGIVASFVRGKVQRPA